jgi:hypothetical protein
VLASLLTLVLGLIITQLLHLFSKPWISTSITLYVVAFVLLVLIMRDQRKAIAALAARNAWETAPAVKKKRRRRPRGTGHRRAATSPRQPWRAT